MSIDILVQDDIISLQGQTKHQTKQTNIQATGLTILINLYHVPVSEQLSNTNRHASGTEVAIPIK